MTSLNQMLYTMDKLSVKKTVISDIKNITQKWLPFSTNKLLWDPKIPDQEN